MSIYHKFGSKEGLFLAIIERYTASARTTLGQLMEQPGLEGIKSLFGEITSAQPSLPAKIMAYLVVNTSLSTHNTTPAISAALGEFRAMVRRQLRGVLEREGVAEAEERSELLLNLLWGQLAGVHIEGEDLVTRQTTRQVELLLGGWVDS